MWSWEYQIHMGEPGERQNLFFRHRIVLALTFLSSLAVTTQARIIHVPGDSAAIQAGINGAVDGDTVLVQPDTYVENINFNGKNIVVASLFLTTGDTSHISSTIIDGDSSGSVVTFESGEDSTAVVTGFTIANGDATKGGGIHCRSSPTISDCSIAANVADLGGGIYCSGLPIISNCTIVGNAGGGVFGGPPWWSSTARQSQRHDERLTQGGNWDYAGKAHSLVRNCTVTGNGGEGIRLESYGGVGISNCTITDNAGSGVRVADAGGYVITGCAVTENSGAGINSFWADAEITDCLVTDNGDVELQCGGGICCQQRHVIISNCTIMRNIAQKGGGIYMWDTSPTISHCTITENVAEEGGGIWAIRDGSTSDSIAGCTIARNSAQNGGGIWWWGQPGNLTITNCILWSGSVDEIYVHSDTPTVTYCDIEGGWEGEGNIECDPWFCDPLAYNYYLAENSCCIGAGEGGTNIGAYGSGCAARGFVLGMVTDVGFNPIEGVAVTALSAFLRDTSDVQGEYFLSGFREDRFDISFAHPDYRDTTVTGILVTSGDTTKLDITMEYITCSLWVETDTVSAGQDVYLYMNVQNRGDASADSLVPHITALGGGAVVLESGPIPLFADVAAGMDTTFRWVFTAEDTHWVHWVGYASGTGHNTGCMITAVEDTTDSVFIQTAARLEILAVTTGVDTVRWGDDNIPVDVIVQNTGEADAWVDSVNLRFVKDTTNLDSEYVTALLDTLDLLPGFSSDVLHFRVAVGWSATEGWVEIHSRIFGNDKNSLEFLSDSVATLPDSFYVTEGFLCGDCNGDRRITAADATYLIAYIHREGPVPIGEGDVNVDQRISVADATYVAAYIYRAGPEPCHPPRTAAFK